MDLFNSEPTNLLPYDGEVYYYPAIFSRNHVIEYYNTLLTNIAWENDEAIMFGKHITTKRKVALYGDNNYAYHYANNRKKALPWTSDLIKLRKKIAQQCNTTFNACLLNLYHNGNEGLGWHSDNEKELGRKPLIASISFGADRKLMFKHKETKQTISIYLEKGSLLIMQGETQTHWLHKLPTTTTVKTPRINLTFRNIVNNNF